MMKLFGRRFAVGLGAVVLIACACVAPVASQDPSLKPLYGSVDLKAGFTPDPFTKEVTAGGPIRTDLGGVNAYVSNAPDFSLNYTAGTFALTFHVESKADTTLLINLPDGKWIANDDGAGNLNPMIKLNNPPSGRYDIYVGTFGKDTAPAILYITELK